MINELELLDYNQLISCEQLTIPEGEVKEISYNGASIWYSADNFNGYQAVEWVCAAKDVGAYINLGFTYDEAAMIYIEQFMDNEPQWLASGEETYPFGASESSGKYRCMLTSPGNAHGIFIYGSNGSTYINVYNKILYQGKNRLELGYNPANLYVKNLDTGETTHAPAAGAVTYTMTADLYLFAQNYNGTLRFNKASGHPRKIGRFSYYDKNNNLICDLYPCYHKLTGTIGMYDRIRKIFLTNVGTGSFTKGADCLPYTNLADPTSTDWCNDSRLSSSSTSGIATFSGTTTTNYFDIKAGDTIRIYGVTFEENNGNRIGAKITTAAGKDGEAMANFPSDAISGGITIMSYEGLEDGIYTFRVHDGYVNAGGQIHAARFSFKTPTDASKVIITVNEEIKGLI